MDLFYFLMQIDTSKGSIMTLFETI